MSETHFYEPAEGHRLPHDPFKAIVAPRPIGWVSTLSADGIPNLAPYSYFNTVCDSPPLLAFSSAGRKDSLTNVEATGEFVWNMATRPLAERMNRSSAPVAADIDEFVLAGIAAGPSRIVAPQRVLESPASIECKLVQIVPLHGLDGRSAGHWLVIGQAVGIHIRREFLRDGLFDTGAAHPIMRAGYRADYFEVGPDALFEMVRPTA